MTAPLRKLAGLDLVSLAELWRAELELLRAGWIVRRRPIGTLARRSTEQDPTPRGDPVRAASLALALERAAEYGPYRPKCLVRSIALRALLEKHGITGSEIRVGVRQRNGSLDAHAWVRWGDRILGDRDYRVARFTEVDDINVLSG